MTRGKKSRTAGQPKSNVSLPPNELEGWTSQGPPRRTPQTRSTSQTSRASTSYLLTKPSSQKKKKKGENYIPRPPNRFMLFRTNFVKEYKADDSEVPPDTNLSKLAGAAWSGLTKAEKAKWEVLAQEAKKQHAIAYPDYKYQPTRPNAKPKLKSRQERQIEESSVTFHSSAESSPASSPAGLPMNDNDPVPPPTAPVNAFPAVPVHSHFIERKQSLRLSNWDDSVLYPRGSSSDSNLLGANNSIPPQSEGFDFQSQSWNLDALQRRSSSAPIPLPLTANSYYPNSGNVYNDDQPSSRHLSYSGIRPGFAFQNTMGSFMEPSSTAQGEMAPLPQVLVAEQPSHELFGDYRISYPEVNNTSPAMFVSPIREMPSISQFSNTDDFQDWSYSHSPENVYSASESPPSVSNFPSSPMPSFEEFIATNSTPGDLFNQVESIRFDAPYTILGQESLHQKDSDTRKVSAADEGYLDSDFAMNLDPRLLDLSTTPPVDASTDFSYNGTEFDSTWDLFDEVK